MLEVHAPFSHCKVLKGLSPSMVWLENFAKINISAFCDFFMRIIYYLKFKFWFIRTMDLAKGKVGCDRLSCGNK